MNIKDLKVNVCTSYYYKIMHRHKAANDFYVQVSRTAFAFSRSVDGFLLDDILDFDFSCLGPETDEDYEEYCRIYNLDKLSQLNSIFKPKNILKKLGIKYSFFGEISPEGEKILKEKYNCTFNFYLLCFENIKSKYTKKDVEKYGGTVVAGQYKYCHRRTIAKLLTEFYGYEVPELEE